jgi:hypothetical protein
VTADQLLLTVTAAVAGGPRTGVPARTGAGALGLSVTLDGAGGTWWAPPDIVTSDVERLVVELLTPALTVRVVTEAPADIEAHLPVVQIQETPGGGQLAPAHDTAVVDYDAYAGSRATAKQVAAQTRAALLDSSGYVTADGSMWINRVTEVRRPTLLFYDDASDIRRFGGSVRLNVRYRNPVP